MCMCVCVCGQGGGSDESRKEGWRGDDTEAWFLLLHLTAEAFLYEHVLVFWCYFTLLCEKCFDCNLFLH